MAVRFCRAVVPKGASVSPFETSEVLVSRGFAREKRLLTPRQFKAVFDSPSDKASGRCVLLLARNNDLGFPRLGLVIGKKSVKLSVERNRIKRQIRESFRHHQEQIGAMDLVIISRRGLADLENPELAKLFAKLWRRIRPNGSENSAPSAVSDHA